MHLLIQKAIEAEAKKRLARHSRNQYYVHKYRSSFTKRTGKRPKSSSRSLPKQWAHHRQYDPRYCLNHSAFLAKGIWSSLLAGTFRPISALRSKIPKPSGGTRYIDAFSVTDTAVSNLFFFNLRSRNAKIFSDSSYAYQNDKTPLDAVLRLRSFLNGQTIFISQYDFSKYFDSILHEHIIQLISKDGPFLTTHMERALLQSILTHSFAEIGKPTQTRSVGIPQGNSLSLFLANIAAHPLDNELGRLNGAFARFADDSVIVNYSYEDALRCADCFLRFSETSGVAINRDKSSGIRIFSDSPSEMAHVDEFDFLGYCFRRNGLYVSDRAIASIKRRCSRIIYNHLLLHPRRVGSFRRSRLGAGFRDWDLVTCLNELRAYVYGGRSQRTVDRYLLDQTKVRNFTGAVSYFCLVEDSAIFRKLDGWLVDSLRRAYAERTRLLSSLSGKAYASLTSQELLNENWYTFPAVSVETKLPSFFTAWRAARKSWERHGMKGVDVRGMGYSY